MPNNLQHFSINADNVERAKTFYEQTFGWQFTAWGPPNFYLIKTGTDEDPGVHGALQRRREIVKGRGRSERRQDRQAKVRDPIRGYADLFRRYRGYCRERNAV